MRICWAIVGLSVLAGMSPAAGNLCTNGTFDAAGDALAGWNVDYRWTGNTKYMDNTQRVSVVAQDGVKRKVLRIDGRRESKADSGIFAFDPKARYRCTLDVRGGTVRIFFAGYKWKPGVRPHAAPPLGELRMVYKSKATMHTSRSWKRVSFEFPLKNVSETGRRHLKQVRFLTVHFLAMGETFIDNVKVTKM